MIEETQFPYNVIDSYRADIIDGTDDSDDSDDMDETYSTNNPDNEENLHIIGDACIIRNTCVTQIRRRFNENDMDCSTTINIMKEMQMVNAIQVT